MACRWAFPRDFGHPADDPHLHSKEKRIGPGSTIGQGYGAVKWAAIRTLDGEMTKIFLKMREPALKGPLLLRQRPSSEIVENCFGLKIVNLMISNSEDVNKEVDDVRMILKAQKGDCAESESGNK